MKVLILSCSMGQGHNTAAEALREALAACGADCTMLDHISLKSERAALKTANAYIRSAVFAPHLFGAAYRIANAISSRNGRSPVYWAQAKYAGLLGEHIRQGEYDAVVTSHLYPAETLTYLRRRGMLKIPFFAVMTDYTCSPFWEETRPDVYFTPSERISEIFLKKGVPREQLLPYGIPVRRTARAQQGKITARERLGIAPGTRLITVMGGSMGGGRMAAVVRELLKHAPEGVSVAALCGSNESLKRHLQKHFSQDGRLRVIGYTDQVALWMEACDVLMTKPGGLTCTEAAVKQVPLVLTAPIPGCETCNAAYFEQLGLASRAFAPDAAVNAALALLDNEAAQQTMRNMQSLRVNARAADDIAREILRAGKDGAYGSRRSP
ncbi:MAG: glycosyl transferase [Clostridiales bacterium]|nr:glycosyl transferase [Clostridiales bacterium]